MIWQGCGGRRWGAGAVVWLIVMVVNNPLAVLGQTVPDQQKKILDESATKLIPSLRIAERYDSNVFFIRGGHLEDYVTTLAPQLRAEHRNRWLEGSLSSGPTAEVFVKNPSLNYVSADAALDLNLDGAMKELVNGLGLRIADTFLYSPQMPSFAAPTGGGLVPESFVRGLQAQRANLRSNVGKVQVRYSLSQSMDVISTYTDQRLRFSNPITPQTAVSQGGLLDTDFQMVASGPVFKISPSDKVEVMHLYQRGTFNVEGSQSGFTTQGVNASWTRAMSQSLEARVEAGFSVLSPYNSVQPLGAASLRWSQGSTTLSLSYTRVITPSFLFIPTPLVSQVVSATVKRQMTEPLSLLLTGSYALNQSVPDSSLVRFESYWVSPSLEYKIGRYITATLSYTRYEFQQVFLGEPFDFDRHMVALSMLAEWR